MYCPMNGIDYEEVDIVNKIIVGSQIDTLSNGGWSNKAIYQ